MKTSSSFARVGFALLALALVPLSHAQAPADKPAADKPPAEKGQRERRGPGRGGDPLKMMTERLKLTDDQVAKLKPILDDQRAQFEKVRDLPQEERRAKMKEINDASDAKILPILTADQAKDFKAMREEQRSRMREGGGGQRRPPGEGKGGGEPKEPKE
jgi:Spy/CpxP family protein refolding chaperone